MIFYVKRTFIAQCSGGFGGGGGTLEPILLQIMWSYTAIYKKIYEDIPRQIMSTDNIPIQLQHTP